MDSCYWARFRRLDELLFRLDTRVYLDPVAGCLPGDPALGAFVGKNPGSARPRLGDSKRAQPIALENDRMLPTIRSLVRRAYQAAENVPPRRGYVQVLNLFYLCEPQLRLALRKVEGIRRLPSDRAERRFFPWMFFGWGKLDKQMVKFARRFRDRSAVQHLYVDRFSGAVVASFPGPDDFAKHTQGMRLSPVVKYLADHVRLQSECGKDVSLSAVVHDNSRPRET